MSGKKRKAHAEAGPAPSAGAPWGSPAVWLFAAALLVRWAHYLLYKDDFWFNTPLLDDNIFVSWAATMEKEGWLAPSLGVFNLNPGYPYFLALMGKTPGRGIMPVFALQHLAGAAAPVLLYLIGLRLYDRRTAIIAGALGALYGPAVFFESRFLGEFWIYFFNLAALACLAQAWRPDSPAEAEKTPPQVVALWGAAGLCLGLSALFRPNVLALIPFVLAWGWRTLRGSKARAAAALCFCAGLWLPMLPFQLRNRAVDPARGWGLTTASGGVNLYLGNNPEADGLNKAPSFIRYGPGHEYEDFKEEAERRAGRPLAPDAVSRYWAGQAWRWVTRRPAAACGLMLSKAGFFWNYREPPDNFFVEIFERFTRMGPIPLASWGLVAPLGLAGFLLSLGEARARRFWILHGYVAAYFGVCVLFYILARYRFPAAAGLIPFAAFALARLSGLARPGKTGSVAVVLVLILAGVGLSRLPLIGEEDKAVSHYSMAVIYANQGWKDKAVEEYHASIREDPSFKASYLNLGILEAERGHNVEAVQALEGALSLEEDVQKRGLLVANIAMLKERAKR